MDSVINLTEITDISCEIQIRLTLLEVKQDQATKASPLTTRNSTDARSNTIEMTGQSVFKTMRIAIPRFYGRNLEAWIQKIEQYYEFH